MAKRRQSKKKQKKRPVALPPWTGLSDEDWEFISAPVRLPRRERLNVDRAIEKYRRECDDNLVSAKSIHKVRLAKARAKKLLDELVKLDRLDDLMKRSPSERDLQHLNQITAACDQIHNCFCALEYVEERLVNDRGSHGYGPLADLAADLDQILSHSTAYRLDYSDKRDTPGGRARAFMRAVFRVARQQISDGKIKQAVDEYLQRKGDRP